MPQNTKDVRLCWKGRGGILPGDGRANTKAAVGAGVQRKRGRTKWYGRKTLSWLDHFIKKTGKQREEPYMTDLV